MNAAGAPGRRAASLAKVLLTAALGLMVLSACYIPTRFNAQSTVNAAGDWTMAYTGILTYAWRPPWTG